MGHRQGYKGRIKRSSHCRSVSIPGLYCQGQHGLLRWDMEEACGMWGIAVAVLRGGGMLRSSSPPKSFVICGKYRVVLEDD